MKKKHQRKIKNNMNLSENLFKNKGGVKLWTSPNISKISWRINGVFGKDIYSYFLLPSRFIFENGNFYFITPFEYIKEEILVDHKGWRPSEKFWRIKPSANKIVELQTDDKTFLPFLETVSQGQPNFTSEKCYFIPTLTDY